MYWLPSIVLQLKMLKLGQESFSPWLWVMIQSCSSIRAVVKLMSYTCKLLTLADKWIAHSWFYNIAGPVAPILSIMAVIYYVGALPLYRKTPFNVIWKIHRYEIKWIRGKFERVANSGVLGLSHKFMLLWPPETA